MSFNFLECFDENIDNLDITKNYIYVLKLIDERYYVGRTGNILRRVKQHFSGYGAKYTKAYKPLKVIEVVEEMTNDDERKMTFKYVDKYGWEKVRGSYWCSLEIKRKLNLKFYENMKIQREKELLETKKINDEIKNMYIVENKNIIEIGEILNITPGTIASRLVKLKIIKDKGYARSYNEYKESDMYKQICSKNISNKINNISNEEAKNLKDKIKTIINNI
jgi:predicted GIY-YIG superfamily endonuclease